MNPLDNLKFTAEQWQQISNSIQFIAAPNNQQKTQYINRALLDQLLKNQPAVLSTSQPMLHPPTPNTSSSQVQIPTQYQDPIKFATAVFVKCAKQDSKINGMEMKHLCTLDKQWHWDELNTFPYKYIFVIGKSSLPLHLKTNNESNDFDISNFEFKLYRMDTNEELPDACELQVDKSNKDKNYVSFKVAFKAKSHDTFGKSKVPSNNQSSPNKKKKKNQRKSKPKILRNSDDEAEEQETSRSSDSNEEEQDNTTNLTAAIVQQMQPATTPEIRKLLNSNRFFQLRIFYKKEHIKSSGRIRLFARRNKVKNNFDATNFGKTSASKRQYVKKEHKDGETPAAKRQRKTNKKQQQQQQQQAQQRKAAAAEQNEEDVETGEDDDDDDEFDEESVVYGSFDVEPKLKQILHQRNNE